MRVGGTGSRCMFSILFSTFDVSHQANITVVFFSRSEQEREKMWALTWLLPPDLLLNPEGSPPKSVCRISNWRINSEEAIFFFFHRLYRKYLRHGSWRFSLLSQIPNQYCTTLSYLKYNLTYSIYIYKSDKLSYLNLL